MGNDRVHTVLRIRALLLWLLFLFLVGAALSHDNESTRPEAASTAFTNTH